ncbi:hypothetical protein MRB53_007289 [Persea americana]|uniref:Uncharacterized protein n=1 Tax=Persea americana TaxID=3435 RepID=A0ACC2MIS8_PERAE|nr:hypothetical protein MRB53_007289 [Persea americana]
MWANLSAQGYMRKDGGDTLFPLRRLLILHVQLILFNNFRANGDDAVTLKILYCGICHTDLHSVKDDFGFSMFPVVPGHEIVGIVTEVGKKVTKFKVGDKAGVGCLVDSCRACPNCNQDVEVYCPKKIDTYNDIYHDGTPTYGGFSDMIAVDKHFVVLFPDNMPLDGGAPLLCAGITAFGLKVTVISTSPSKEKEAIERLGADSFLVSRDLKQMEAAKGTLDGIIDTVSAPHAFLPLIDLLKCHGKLVIVGVPGKLIELPVIPLLMGKKLVAGSAIGGLKETQEMIDFAAKHNVTADIEVVPMDYINTAMERLAKGDVRYRFVIDIGNTLKAPVTEMIKRLS